MALAEHRHRIHRFANRARRQVSANDVAAWTCQSNPPATNNSPCTLPFAVCCHSRLPVRSSHAANWRPRADKPCRRKPSGSLEPACLSCHVRRVGSEPRPRLGAGLRFNATTALSVAHTTKPSLRRSVAAQPADRRLPDNFERVRPRRQNRRRALTEHRDEHALIAEDDGRVLAAVIFPSTLPVAASSDVNSPCSLVAGTLVAVGYEPLRAEASRETSPADGGSPIWQWLFPQQHAVERINAPPTPISKAGRKCPVDLRLSRRRRGRVP